MLLLKKLIHGLILSPHVPGELTDSQMDAYVEAFQNPDQQVREANYQSMLASLTVCPSQYVHDYLFGILEQSNDPSVNLYINRAMLAGQCPGSAVSGVNAPHYTLHSAYDA